MNNEILNIDYHLREAVLKALNRTHTKGEACKLLGLPEKTLYNHIERFEIFYNDKKSKYETRQQTEVVTINMVYTSRGRKVSKHI